MNNHNNRPNSLSDQNQNINQKVRSSGTQKLRNLRPARHLACHYFTTEPRYTLDQHRNEAQPASTKMSSRTVTNQKYVDHDSTNKLFTSATMPAKQAHYKLAPKQVSQLPSRPKPRAKRGSLAYGPCTPTHNSTHASPLSKTNSLVSTPHCPSRICYIETSHRKGNKLMTRSTQEPRHKWDHHKVTKYRKS